MGGARGDPGGAAGAAGDAGARRLVVLDIDDTLYLERDYARSGFTAIGDWARAELGVDDLGERAWAAFEAGTRGTIFDEALAAAGVDRSRVIGAGMALAAPIDRQKGVLGSTVLPGWAGIQAGEELSRRLEIPVELGPRSYSVSVGHGLAVLGVEQQLLAGPRAVQAGVEAAVAPHHSRDGHGGGTLRLAGEQLLGDRDAVVVGQQRRRRDAQVRPDGLDGVGRAVDRVGMALGLGRGAEAR